MNKEIECIYREKLIEQKKRTIIVRKEKKQVQEQLIEELKKELEVLDNYDSKKVIKEQKLKIEQLTKELNVLKRRYDALKNSKLGRITLKYWDLKRRKR